MVSEHYNSKRYSREEFINEHLHGDGNIIDEFIVDKGHPHGAERHCVTDNGIIVIYNAITNKLVTKKIARPKQIKDLYATKNKSPPQWLLNLAEQHKRMGMYQI